MHTRGRPGQHGKPHGVVSADQLVFREEMSRPDGVADGPVVLGKPGNAGGGKEPEFKTSAGSGKGKGIDDESGNSG